MGNMCFISFKQITYVVGLKMNVYEKLDSRWVYRDGRRMRKIGEWHYISYPSIRVYVYRNKWQYVYSI